MSEPIEHDHRLQVMRATLDVMRALHGGHLAGDRFGTDAPDTLLLLAVMVGQLEGRPMPAAKLADYAGQARPTVIRRLREMAAAGIVEQLPGGAFQVPADRLNSPQALMAARDAQRALGRAMADRV